MGIEGIPSSFFSSSTKRLNLLESFTLLEMNLLVQQLQAATIE